MAKSDNRNPRQPRKPMQEERDNRLIAQMYFQGKSQMDMAKELGVTQATVSRTLKAMVGEWRRSSLVDINEAKQKELARIDSLELEYWAAWEKSKGKKQEKSLRSKGRPKGTRGEQQVTEIESVETTVREWEETGDPRFLDGVSKCIAQRVAILGLGAAQKTYELTAQTPVPILRRVAAGMDVSLAFAEYASGINADKWGKE